MRNLPLAVAVVSLCLSIPAAWAVDEHHPEQQGATGQPAASPAAPAASAGMDDKQMLKMQDSMLNVARMQRSVMRDQSRL